MAFEFDLNATIHILANATWKWEKSRVCAPQINVLDKLGTILITTNATFHTNYPIRKNKRKHQHNNTTTDGKWVGSSANSVPLNVVNHLKIVTMLRGWYETIHIECVCVCVQNKHGKHPKAWNARVEQVFASIWRCQMPGKIVGFY